MTTTIKIVIEKNMKNIVRVAFLVFLVGTLSSCAFSEKSKIRLPPAASDDQSAPVYIEDSGDPKELGQPGAQGVQGQQAIVEEDIEVVVPSAVYVNDRIYEYGRKLDRWKELDRQAVTRQLSEKEMAEMVNCFRQLQDVLNGYSNLRSKMLQVQAVGDATRISNEDIFELQTNDIAFLENECGRLLADSPDQSGDWRRREAGGDLVQYETLIDRYATNKEYEQLVQVWSKIPQSERSRTQLKTKILYGNALMSLYQEERAAAIYQQVVDQISQSDEQATDLVSLRKTLADLYTASGNYRSASVQYKKISEDYQQIGQQEEWSKFQLSMLDRSPQGSPELDEYSDLLRNYLGYMPARDGYKLVWQAEKFQTSYPYSPVVANVEIIKTSAMNDADRWFNGFIGEVDRLVAEKSFAQAIGLLESMSPEIIDAEKQLIIKAKNDELLLAEAVDQETGRMAKMQDLQNQWNSGMLLAKDGRYEEAIVVFTSLQDSEYSVKAETKIKELSLEAAKEDRRQAADLFIRYTKTNDLESKKKLLVESRKLLKNILVKYPDVEIAPKVLGNIERVEQEMDAIDPNLVFMADQEELPMVQDDKIDAVFTMPETKTMNLEQTPSGGSNQNESVNQ